MYTAKLLRRTIDKQRKRIYLDIAYYLNGATEPDATETKEFALDVTLEQVTRYANGEAKRLAAVDPAVTDGAILDLASVTEEPVTEAELAQQEWFRDFERLERVQQLITLGVLTGTETPVVNLRNKLKTNFKPAYIADM